MTSDKRIAIVGAGLIGARHAQYLSEAAIIDAIIDPNHQTAELAQKFGTRWFRDVGTYLQSGRPDGAILATPNQLHVKHALEFLEIGVPLLIEKPIADTSVGARSIVDASLASGVPVLVGHHRRHNNLIQKAKATIEAGEIGRVVAISAQFLLYKPDDYFAADWRRMAGGGPVFINLIHDVDLIRYLCGEVVAVQAMESSDVRGFEVEDTAGVLLRFENGAIGTISISDTAVTPWSWEFTSGENAAYPNVDTHAYRIAGTHGSLSVPDLKLWRHVSERSWWEPIEASDIPYENGDPLALQIEHFLDVISGKADPLVSAEEGLKTLRVTEAIKEAASSGKLVYP